MDEQESPIHLDGMREAAVTAIRAAFHGVTREGGVSWTQAVIVDDDGSGRSMEQALAEDTEGCWEDLVDDPRWVHEVGIGGFNCLDPIGYRYYIAPAMIRCAREGYGEFIAYALTIDGDFKEDLVSLINPRQAAAIAQLIRFMSALDAAEGSLTSEWTRAYSYWRRFDAGDARAG